MLGWLGGGLEAEAGVERDAQLVPRGDKGRSGQRCMLVCGEEGRAWRLRREWSRTHHCERCMTGLGDRWAPSEAVNATELYKPPSCGAEQDGINRISPTK